MLTPQEKIRVKDVLKDGLGINPNINLPYFLNAIDQTKKDVQSLRSQLDAVMFNQRIIDGKLDSILELLRRK